MRKGFNLFNHIAAKLGSDHFKFIIQPRRVKGQISGTFLHQLNQPGTGGLGVAQLGQGMDERGLLCFGAKPQIRQPQNLCLRHRDATDDPAQVFAQADLVQKLLYLGKFVIGGQSLCPILQLMQRLSRGGQPSQPMRGCLVLILS